MGRASRQGREERKEGLFIPHFLVGNGAEDMVAKGSIGKIMLYSSPLVCAYASINPNNGRKLLNPSIS